MMMLTPRVVGGVGSNSHDDALTPPAPRFLQGRSDVTGGSCQQCGSEFARNLRGRPRRFCSEKCRIASYRLAHSEVNRRYYQQKRRNPQTDICFGTCDECGRFHARRLATTAVSFIKAGGILRCYGCAKVRRLTRKLERERERRAEWRDASDPRYEILRSREDNKSHRRRVRISATSDVSNAEIADLRRSRKTCPNCGCRFSSRNPATIEHIIPLALGGTHTRDNLRLWCRSCNSSRGARLDDVSGFQLNLEMRVEVA